MVHASDGRYRLLEVMRDYAAERLGSDPEPRQRHTEHFASLAAKAELQLSGADQTDWLERLDIEHDNLRAALDWLAAGESTAAAELQMAAALGRFWYVRGHIGEGMSRLRHAIDSCRQRRHRPPWPRRCGRRPRLPSSRATTRSQMSSPPASLSAYRTLGDRSGVARSLSNLGAIQHAQGELDVAAAHPG